MRPALCALLVLSASAAAQTGADPLGLGPLADNRPVGAKTQITAQKEATFDEKKNVAVFIGNVRVTDPGFLLASEKLTVTLTADRSGIERAIAEGNVVIVQRTPDDKEGENKGAVGRAQRVEYTPATGRATLSGSPQIQQGINRHIATSPGTRMILNRDGRASTVGPSRTVITDTSAPELP
jgi:lipopolysaccharide transport protein LptA